MKKWFNLLFNFLIFSSLSAQNITLSWAKQLAGNKSTPSSIYTDASGSIFTTGKFTGTVDFDPGVNTYTLYAGVIGDWETFISKLDASGNFIWARQFKGLPVGSPYSEGLSINVDNLGNVYVLGTFSTITDFDPSPATFTLDPLQGSIYVSKLDANGTFLFAKQIGDGTLSGSNARMTLDQNFNLLIAGRFYVQADFDPSVSSYILNPNGGSVIFVCKLSSTGNFIWAKQMGGSGMDAAYYIDKDALGNIYLNDTIQYTVDMDPGMNTYTLNAANGPLFICKMDASGNFVFAIQYGTGVATSAQELKLDKWGNIYVTGNYTGNSNFNTGPSIFNLSPTSSGDIYLAKYTPQGNFNWVKSFSGSSGSFSSGSAISVDTANGDIFFTGYYTGTVDFDPGPNLYSLTSIGNRDIFLSKLDTSGSLIFAKSMGGISLDQGISINCPASQVIYLTGNFRDVSDFDPNAATYTLSAPGTDYNTYVAKYVRCNAPDSPTLSPITQSGCGTSTFALNAIGTGTMHWSNNSTSNVYLGSGPTFVTPALSPGTYSYYALATNNCAESLYSAAVTITIHPLPTILALSNTSVLCKGDTAQLSASGALTYTWNNIYVIPTLNVFPLANTTYTVKGTDVNGCINTSTITQQVKNCNVGINENETSLLSIKVFPNPSQGEVTITSLIPLELTLLDLCGRIISTFNLKIENSNSINLKLPAGLYFIKCYSLNNNFSQKLIVIQ